MPSLLDRDTRLALLDRMRRQALDVLAPVLVLVAAGQIHGLDVRAALAMLVTAWAATAVGFIARAEPTAWWQRILVTAAGAVAAITVPQWRDLIDAGWSTVAAAVAGSVALALLRTGTSRGQVIR